MIPIRDQIPTRRVPFVNYLLILTNIIVFVFQWLAGSNQEAIVYQFALIPASFSNGIGLGDLADVFTSMFMHAGLAHLGGNMLYLWIFGDNSGRQYGARKILFILFSRRIGGLTGTHFHKSWIANPNRRCKWCDCRGTGSISCSLS